MSNGGLLTKLFGGPASGLLTEEQKRVAEKRALVDFGLSMLESGAPPDFGRAGTPLGAAIARGTRAGRDAFTGIVEEVLGVQKIERGREAKSREDAMLERRDTSRDKLRELITEGETLTTPMLENMWKGAIQGDDLEMAKTLWPMVQQAKAVEAAEAAALAAKVAPSLSFQKVGDQMWALDPKTGEIITKYTVPEGVIMDPAKAGILQRAISQFHTETADLKEIPTQYRRVLASTSKALSAYDATGKLIKGAEQDVAFSTVAALSAFARLIDPGSVVRSAEMEILLKQGSWGTIFKNFLTKAKAGVIEPTLLRALQAEAAAQLRAQEKPYLAAKNRHEAQVFKLGFTEENFAGFGNPYQAVSDEFNLDVNAPIGPAAPGGAPSPQDAAILDAIDKAAGRPLARFGFTPSTEFEEEVDDIFAEIEDKFGGK